MKPQCWEEFEIDKSTPTGPKAKNVILENDSLYVTSKTISRNEYSIYMLNNISYQKSYRPMFDLLRQMKVTDKVTVFMNNHGGSVHTGIDIINSIRACEAQTKVVVTGPLYSMAPLIALQGNTIVVESNSFFMFHDYSTLEGGKGSEIEASVKHYRKFFLDCLADWCKGFLSKKEIIDIHAGKDLYLSTNEVKERLSKIGRLEE